MKTILAAIIFCFVSVYAIGQIIVPGNDDNVTYNNSISVGTASTTVTMDTTSGIRLTGGATTWDDLMFPFSTGQSGGLSYPTFNADSNYYTFVVDTTGPTKCMQYFIIQMPHRWKQGSAIHPHVHYKHETGVGTPKFIMKYKWYALDGTTAKGWGWYKMETTTGTTDKTHQLVYGSGGISGTGMGFSSMLVCQIYLSAAPTNVNAWQFDIHYEIDGFGSEEEVAKH